MKFTIISDTHKKHQNLELGGGDILLHCGDFSGRGTKEQIIDFNEWLGTLDYKHKVIIAGNHDFMFEQQPEEARRLITNATYLEDSFIEIDSIKIYGSPWQPWFHNWAFNLKRGHDLAEKWSQIPSDTDILMTHGPPYSIGDKTYFGEHVGCKDLLSKINKLDLKLHCFGHIHEDSGSWLKNGTTFINASICDHNYQPNNPVRHFSL